MTEHLTALGCLGAGLGILLLLVMALAPLLLEFSQPTPEPRAGGIDSGRGRADSGQ